MARVQPRAVGCVEILTQGFFARPSPYIAWLGARVPLVVRASPLLAASAEAIPLGRLAALAGVCKAADARFVVHPLGCAARDNIRLSRIAPLPHIPGTLRTSAAHLRHASATCRGTTLAEPIAAPLRVKGSMPEGAFLSQLCEEAAAGCSSMSRRCSSAAAITASMRTRGWGTSLVTR